MDFTIVTPSFRQLEQLQCCIASIADQEGVSVEHIVQDGGTEGFADFVLRMAERWPDRAGYRRIMVSEPDQGMYDAINRGLGKATGPICAYLNCDEQYLPGVLKEVRRVFSAHPSLDVLLGDVIVVDELGRAICHRRMIRPGLAHTWTCHFAALTAGIFFRRSVIDQGMVFDTSYRAAADADWFVKILRRNLAVQILGKTTSAFMELGGNLGLTETAQRERQRLTGSAPFWMQILRPLWVLGHRLRRWTAGAHCPRTVSYAIFRGGDRGRVEFKAAKLRTTWPGRMWGF